MSAGSANYNFPLKPANTDRYEDDSNQQWTFERFGPGYSIRSALNGAYLTVRFRNPVEQPIEPSWYPVSWELQVYNLQRNIFWIGWPCNRAVFDLRDFGNPRRKNKTYMINEIQLNDVNCGGSLNAQISLPNLQLSATPTWMQPGQTIADTVIDAEGLRIGGNGELAITTTTTTTTVTRVRRLNVR
ncbi:hypothetical protein L218DRAFT_950867 [Marasmius fiardii PR-910]|nr:hypothetical protein L218DRAFT_950867 [Marasmius fiardii PR-910]